MRTFWTGIAAVALLASGAHAQGKGNGQDGGGKGKAETARGKQDRGDRGKGNAKADREDGKGQDRGRDKGDKADRGHGNGNSKADRGERGANRDNGNRANRDAERRAAQDKRPDKAERGRPAPPPARDARNARGAADRFDERRTADRDETRRDRYEDRRETVRYADRRDNYEPARDRYDDRYDYRARDRDRAVIDGCPPGLAKKNNGCTPPGLARGRERTVFGYDYRPRYFGLTNYRDDRYRYNDGYLVRYGNDDRISGWIPLLGGALAVGNVWPQRYESYELPNYYVDYYDLGGADRYRYADNVIYRVDPGEAAITSIAALLTGDQFTVGQPMPSGYDVYNVPYGYRDRYADGPDAMYRYSDGQIYRMDPTTRLVQAVIGLLV